MGCTGSDVKKVAVAKTAAIVTRWVVAFARWAGQERIARKNVNGESMATIVQWTAHARIMLPAIALPDAANAMMVFGEKIANSVVRRADTDGIVQNLATAKIMLLAIR